MTKKQKIAIVKCEEEYSFFKNDIVAKDESGNHWALPVNQLVHEDTVALNVYGVNEEGRSDRQRVFSSQWKDWFMDGSECYEKFGKLGAETRMAIRREWARSNGLEICEPEPRTKAMTMGTIIDLSPSYHHTHGVSEGDVMKANRLKGIIEDYRKDSTVPMPGDTIIMIGPKARYENGFLQGHPKDYSSMCVQPYVPFVTTRTNKQGLIVPCFDASGGYWLSQKDGEEFKHVGRAPRNFKAWGWCGPQADGAFHFQATVNVWEFYSEKIY